ncbi:MAG: 50S ribosomal protein L29 [Alphaproteobacteria bacterium]|nr:50S ribosomal protein L29 [Alphaproteobacteria bacterium]
MSNTSEDLRAKSVDELSQLVLDLRKEQFNQRFQKSQGTLENTAQIRKNRREIARAKTILTQKRQDEAKKTSGKKAA